MSEVKHELRRYQDGDGLTHWVSWDDDDRIWYRVCDVRRTVPGKPDDDHDSYHDIVTCVRCMNRQGVFFMTERVGISLITTRALSKIDFDLE